MARWLAPFLGLVALGCTGGPAADDSASDTSDTSDTAAGGCPSNWYAPYPDTPEAALISISDGALRMEAGTNGIGTHTDLGAAPGTGLYGSFVLRVGLDEIHFVPGGRLVVTFTSQYVSPARMEISETGAHLAMAPEQEGPLFDLPFTRPPTHGVIEYEAIGTDLGDDAQIRVRGMFFDAADGEVLTGVLLFGAPAGLRFDLTGPGSSLVVGSYTYIPFQGAVSAEEFDCDSLSSDTVSPAWPFTATATTEGTPCTDVAQCGPAEECAPDGKCRRVCFTSAVCQGQTCLGTEPGVGGVCRVPADNTCVDGVGCAEGLVCGPDDTCRTPCTGGLPGDRRGTCPLPASHCVNGACADNDELGAAAAGGWGGCVYGDRMCQGADLVACNITGPGYGLVQDCAPSACQAVYVDDEGVVYNVAPEDANTFACVGCQRVCWYDGNIHAGGCGIGAEQTLDEICPMGFAACGYGTGIFPLLDPICQDLIAVTVPADPIGVDLGGAHPFAIDATEVRRSDYLGFLQHQLYSATSTPSACTRTGPLWESYLPTDWPWFDGADQPVQVDWCNAHDYCAWRGGRLCGGLDGSALAMDDVGNPAADEWAYACTSAAAGISDLAGGVAEWSAACAADEASGSLTDSCRRHTGSGPSDCGTSDGFPRGTTGAGVRCCYDAP